MHTFANYKSEKKRRLVQRLLAWRLENKVSIRRLGKMLGIYFSTVNRWFQNASLPNEISYHRVIVFLDLGGNKIGNKTLDSKRYKMIQYDTAEMVDKIELLRLAQGWTQQEIANRLGVARVTYSRWLGKQIIPSKIHSFRMKKLLDENQ
jgi:transcriptional regulator with XRE-family HTH domain